MQRLPASGSPAGTAPPIVHEVLGSPGQPLDAATRAFMEPRFGHDFGQVRVHTDRKAAESAVAINALAYTVGRDVVFGGGQHAPEANAGRRLIAHELTHFVQQENTAAAPALCIVDPSSGQWEQEASQAADAVLASRPLPALSSASCLVQRQDAGPVGRPDAEAGAPDAGGVGPPGPVPAPPGPATPAPVSPAPAPAAFVQRVTGITVANQADAITYPEPSTLGAAGRKHFVTVAGSGPEVIVEATLAPAGAPALGAITWTGATPDPGNPTRATVPRARAGKREVTASAGGASASLTVWAVFVQVTSGSVVLSPAPAGAAPYFRQGTINFTGTVFPASTITDADRPDLSGANTVNPSGTNSCGNALSGGADHKWDMSRQIDQEVINPNAIPVPAAAPDGPACLWARVLFPADNAVGNDDANVGGENNDPYAGGGAITSTDTPAQPLSDALGNNGDTLEFHLRFREFARLEYHRTWWLVSHRLPWSVTFRATKVGGRWVDNGTTAAP